MARSNISAHHTSKISERFLLWTCGAAAFGWCITNTLGLFWALEVTAQGVACLRASFRGYDVFLDLAPF